MLDGMGMFEDFEYLVILIEIVKDEELFGLIVEELFYCLYYEEYV